MATASKKTPATTKATASATTKTATKKVGTKPAVTKTTAKETASTTVKKTVSKVAEKKPTAAKTTSAEVKPVKKAAAKETVAKESKPSVTPQQRYHMIATAAYYLAQKRGFAVGYAVQDWITAENQIDSQLKS